MLTRILNRFNLIPIPIYGKTITSTQRFINDRDNFSLIKNQQPSFFLDDSFNLVSILFFSLTISVKTAIKANNIAHGTLSTIQKTQQLNIHSSGLEPAKLSYLAGGFDQNNIFPCDLPVANILDNAASELF